MGKPKKERNTIERTLDTLLQIKQDYKRGDTGVEVCPDCRRRTLNFIVSEYNGHVRANCETCGLSFQE